MIIKTEPITIYVSGGMSGIKDHNFPAFEAATKDLRNRGFIVISPHENDNGHTGESWHYYMKQDVKHVANSDELRVLPGWEKSRGARVEVLIAHMLKLPIKHYETDEEVSANDLIEAINLAADDISQDLKVEVEKVNVLEEALSLVKGNRGAAYGHPFYDYSCTVGMYNTWLKHKYPNGFTCLTIEDAVMFMVMVKLSREGHKHKRDSLVDAAGYILCYEMVKDKIIENETK